MFNLARISRSDLYLVPDSGKEEYGEWFASDAGTVMYDPASGFAAAGSCFLYGPEVYRLYTGAGSVHLEDGLAARTAELLVSINEISEEANP